MRKLQKVLLCLLLGLFCTFDTCNHVHDDKCGYNFETQEGCTHECEFNGQRDFKDPHK